jgi:hypothetical protein
VSSPTVHLLHSSSPHLNPFFLSCSIFL